MSTIRDRIQIDPDSCHGKPMIRGTRVPVAIVTGSIEAGMAPDDVIRGYGITAEDIDAALSFTESGARPDDEC